jgi:ApbE superfamily uncharacterized protein (UPF0280 family)
LLNYNILKKQKKSKIVPASYQNRTYRSLLDTGELVSFKVMVKETDLHVMAYADLHIKTAHLITQYRNQLENYISRFSVFLTSLTPLELDVLAPPIIKNMMKAGLQAGVGPMAAVAGAMAEFVGGDLLRQEGCGEIVVENGGDIFLKRSIDCRVGIFAGQSPLSNKVGLKIVAANMPVGICTSSATVGHSLSFGQADAVTVLASSVCLADAAATRLGNETKGKRPIDEVLKVAESIEGIIGVIVIRGEELGAWGEVELVEL